MTRLIGFIVAAMAGFLGGYLVSGYQQRAQAPGPPPAAEAPAPDTPAARPERPADSLVAVIGPVERPRVYSSLVDSAMVDVDGDGEDERIEVYADVGRDDRGVLAWDDGQRWAVVVRDGSAAYQLFDDFVQLGSVHFTAFTAFNEGSDTPAEILLSVLAPNRDRVVRYVFSRGQGGFVRSGLVEAGGNVVHRSPGSYDGPGGS